MVNLVIMARYFGPPQLQKSHHQLGEVIKVELSNNSKMNLSGFWLELSNTTVWIFRNRGNPPPGFGGRTISFLVKFETSVFCTLVAKIGLLGYFIPHLMNKKADYGFKVLKKWTSKTEKMRKCIKTANFGHVLVY